MKKKTKKNFDASYTKSEDISNIAHIKKCVKKLLNIVTEAFISKQWLHFS